MEGKESFTIDAPTLARGLRPHPKTARNSGFMSQCIGFTGKDGVLHSLDEIVRVATDTLDVEFPYPQIFVFTNVIIVCTATTIYEWVDEALVSKLTTTAAYPWVATDFYDFIYMSNGNISVTRSSMDHTYSVSSLPACLAMCNYNGQVLIGSPNE